MIATNKKMKVSTLIAVVIIAILAVGCTFTAAPSEGNDSEPENDAPTHLERISVYLEESTRQTFSPYYELLDFIISDYEEEIVDGKTEATFQYKVVSKNYDKDPDTVGYIKEAKESGDINYQQLYDEYLQPQDMNFIFKVIIDEDDSIKLYSNASPVGTEWIEVEMDDYIMR